METLGRYQIQDEIGRGGCGIVYRALDPGIGRTVAIKTIQAAVSADADLRERFRREARSAGNLSHPSIVTLFEFDDSDGVMFIAMEFVDGPTLAEKMAGGERLPLDFVLGVVRSAADALDYAHANNIVHRDVKPANFMINPAGQLKMTDFGIAKMKGNEISLTNTGMIIGTAQYMSPEQIAAKPATGRSDQFSLAVIVYEMLTGKKPFQGDSWASVMHEIMSSDPPPVAQHRQDLGESVTTVLRKAMAKDPAGRYPTCKEFADEVSNAVMGITLHRTSSQSLSAAMKKPLPSPRAEELPATEVMATGQTAVAAAPGRGRGMRLGGALAAALVIGIVWVWASARKGSDRAVATAANAVTPRQAAAEASPAEPAPASAIATVSPSRPKPQAIKRPEPAARNPPPIAQAAAVETPAVAAPAEKAPAPAPFVPPPVPVPTATPVAAPAFVPTPAPAPMMVLPPLPVTAPAPAARPTESDDARKTADLAAARKAVDDALNRYRLAFESKDSDALKAVWPGLGRSELNSFQNFFKIARNIKLQLTRTGEAEITASGATVPARRTMTAADERGAMPQQDQNVKITLRRAANTMVIDSIEAVGR